jgi:sec-independent protein translocase protein TatA
MFGIGTTELLLILVVILLLFGAGRIPQVMGGLGKGIKEFKKGLKDSAEEPDEAPSAPAAAVAQQLKSGLGKQVRLLPDGTLEVGVAEGATMVEVDQAWVTLQAPDHTDKVPLVQVKRIVFRA